MRHTLEFSGRLGRQDGKDVAAGVVPLRFRLHLRSHGPEHVWEEFHPAVPVALGGSYSVLLGELEALEAEHVEAVRWLAVAVVRGEHAVEVAPRAPIAAESIRTAEALAALEARVAAAAANPLLAPGADVEARKRVLRLHRRLKRLESAAPGMLVSRLRAVESRLAALDDAETGRVMTLADQLDDLTGTDGELVDLLERVEALEAGHGGPMKLADPAALERRVEALERTNAELTGHLARAMAAIEALGARLAAQAAAPPADTLPGPLTVQKGGIHVASGGLVVHDIEGRLAGASKREGALLVNSHSGGDLVVGNKERGNVVTTGAVRAARAAGTSRALAVRVQGEALEEGLAVALDTRRKQSYARLARPGEAAVGVVVRAAGIELGEGPLAVAVSGVVRVRILGELAVGSLVAAGEGGVAVPGQEGTAFGRSVSPADKGWVEVLLHSR